MNTKTDKAFNGVNEDTFVWENFTIPERIVWRFLDDNDGAEYGRFGKVFRELESREAVIKLVTDNKKRYMGRKRHRWSAFVPIPGSIADRNRKAMESFYAD